MLGNVNLADSDKMEKITTNPEKSKEIIEQLSKLNTAPEREGEDALFGPGVRIDLPPEKDPVEQMLLTIVEEEIAYLVMMRISRICGWKILDPETGRELNP